MERVYSAASQSHSRRLQSTWPTRARIPVSGGCRRAAARATLAWGSETRDVRPGRELQGGQSRAGKWSRQLRQASRTRQAVQRGRHRRSGSRQREARMTRESDATFARAWVRLQDARCEMRPRPLELQPRQSAIQSGLGLLSRKCKLASAPARSSAAAYYVCPGSGLHVHNLTLQPATCYLLPACHLQSQASFFFTLGPGQTATNGTLIEGMRGRAGRATAADTYRHAPRLALGGAGRAR